MKSFRSNDLLLPISSSLAGMGFSSSWVFTSLYMNTELGISYFFAGLAFTVSGICAAVSQIYAGKLGDRLGHKSVLMSLVLISGFAYLAIFLVSGTMHRPLLFSALFVINIAVNSAIMSPLNSLVSLSSSSPLKGFSYLRMGNNVGWGFGPVIGGIIVTFYGYPYIYLLGVAMNVVNALVIISVTNARGKVTARKRQERGRINPMYFYLGLSALLLFMIQGQESVTLPNFAGTFRSMTAFDIGIIFFVNGFIVILLQVPIVNITARMGLSRGYIFGIVLYALGFFSMAFDYTLLEFVISMTVATIGENFAFPAGNAIVSTLSRNENIGQHMGVYNGFISMGRSMGPVLGGIALSVFLNPVKLWGVVSASGAVAIAIYLAKLSRRVSEEEGRYSSEKLHTG